MMRSMAPHLIGLSVVLWSCGTLATPFPLQIIPEGSAAGEEQYSPTSSLPAFFDEYQTTPGGKTRAETTLLDEVIELLHNNLLFLLVGVTLLLIVLLIICGAVFLSRRRRVNTYYPCAFPSKMYVDQRDKTGGTGPFVEVPQKTSKRPENEPTNSCKQLQEDIMRAAKSLRTPIKSPGEREEPSERTADSVSDGEPPSPGKHKEPPADAAAEVSNEELPLISPEKTESRGEVPESRPGPCPLQVQPDRPASQHVHADSPTLQLITGEKTAF